ncbi:MAG: asparagine synthetase B [Cytophagales bacterium]|nr:asparagine synthetase B [Cytophagales bacterium]
MLWLPLRADHLFVPMDDTQSNHLKAYGVAYWILERQIHVDWLLNYRGGSFLFTYEELLEQELIIRGVSYQILGSGEVNQILDIIAAEDSNMDLMKLEKVPKIAVYSPESKQPWDDAVTLVLSYAQIPYDLIFDDEIIHHDLVKYDWLHLHHEDFTGQGGKFLASHGNSRWYQQQQKEQLKMAHKHGFRKISKLKSQVVNNVKDYVKGGGFLFAMCSATDTFDIALAAQRVDICESVYDGDPVTPGVNTRLDFEQTFAFTNFKVTTNPYVYEYSDIDTSLQGRGVGESNDYFTLFQFSAKWDPIPTMLTQNHLHVIKGFMGQTTAFRKDLIKSSVITMGENKDLGEARYIHGTLGKGFWTFYGGHDPEDYQHFVGEPPTDLNLHANSAGYRLILNNILFPSARKKKLKT